MNHIRRPLRCPSCCQPTLHKVVSIPNRARAWFCSCGFRRVASYVPRSV